MKKRHLILTGFLAFSLLLSAASGAAAIFTSRQLTSTAVMATEENYVLRTADGSICVFRNGILLLDTGLSPAGLPTQEREALARGVEVEGNADLQSLLEDFSS